MTDSEKNSKFKKYFFLILGVIFAVYGIFLLITALVTHGIIVLFFAGLSFCVFFYDFRMNNQSDDIEKVE